MPISQIGLTPPQRKTLEYFEYSPESDQLEGAKAIGTTLNSIFLGGHHQASSGDENVFWTNLTSNINYFPAWGGLKDQSVPANQDYTGIREVEARVYDDDLSFEELDGPIGGAIVDYNSVSTNSQNYSVHGIRIRMGQNLDTGNIIQYRLYLGTDNTGTQIYEQDFVVDAPIASGDYFEFWFNHPSEDFMGTTIYSEATVLPFQNAEEQFRTNLQVYATSGDPTLRWFELRYRGFTDKQLARVEQLEPIYLVDDFTLDQSGKVIAADTDALGPLTIMVDETRCRAFTVYDIAANWNQDSCFVVIGSDTYELDKQNKGYSFFFSEHDSEWHLIEHSIQVA